MGRLFSFFSINDFIPDEKHQYLANHKFNWGSIICYLWNYVSHIVADNYNKHLYIRSKYLFFVKTLPK